ncbi:hypothetical protein [Thalassolituus sp. UBA3500]|uniref:hypothetical protein n=1 Tax=Thalassolituus sp. UBA3500 TaxID=1947664 RepID=UPI000C0E00F9|nr:hypothetical protein [Thalassolituus sp. UBA3500]MBN58705.1 hypothetical protein [Oceanospirillaceae bacterium]|tara:strand:+ start:3808 stop:4362 length:555 start_codon:yes stop_codon:yes gene_type:complete
MKVSTEQYINELAVRVYEQNKRVGWWDNPDRCIFQTLQLVNTEIAEATEGDRKSLMDDKLPHRVMAEVEIADTVIRLVDLAGRYKWHYEAAIPASLHLAKMDNAGARHLVATITVCDLAKEIILNRDNHCSIAVMYSMAVSTLLKIADIEGYDLTGAIEEKLEFNANRSDHKRSNRAKKNGKAY